jgi:hypothetical protein
VFFFLKKLKKPIIFYVFGVTIFSWHFQPWPENGKEIALFKWHLHVKEKTNVKAIATIVTSFSVAFVQNC